MSAQNVEECAALAAKRATEAESKLQDLLVVVRDLARAAEKDRDNHRADWGNAGSLGDISNRLDAILAGYAP